MALWKKILAVTLFLTAVVFGLQQWKRSFPEQSFEQPAAVQFQQDYAQSVQEEFQRNIHLMNLDEETEQQLKGWLAENPKTKEERQARNKRLKEILTLEQIDELKEYQQLRNDQMKALQNERKARIVRMVGHEDAARLAEDQKKIREQRKQRIAEQKAREEAEQ